MKDDPVGSDGIDCGVAYSNRATGGEVTTWGNSAYYNKSGIFGVRPDGDRATGWDIGGYELPTRYCVEIDQTGKVINEGHFLGVTCDRCRAGVMKAQAEIIQQAIRDFILERSPDDHDLYMMHEPASETAKELAEFIAARLA